MGRLAVLAFGICGLLLASDDAVQKSPFPPGGTVHINASSGDLAGAMRRAESAHGAHERRTGQPDADWPQWYAKYMVAEQANQELPK